MKLYIMLPSLLFLSDFLSSPCHASRATPPSPSFSKFRTVNLGGWLVTEGWIKPSLFDGIPNKDFLVSIDISRFFVMCLCKLECIDLLKSVEETEIVSVIDESNIRIFSQCKQKKKLLLLLQFYYYMILILFLFFKHHENF